MPKRKTKKSWLHRKLKLSQHKHTGRRLPNHHTSYGVLVCLMVLTGLILAYATKVQAASEGFSVSVTVPATPENTHHIGPQPNQNPGAGGINQIPAPTPSSNSSSFGNVFSWNIDDIWFFFVIVFLALCLFWLGERYEYEKLKPNLWKNKRRLSLKTK